MQLDDASRNDARQTKRANLTKIVRRLGSDATPDAIRQECYAVGVGRIQPAMLVSVRNELFPDRTKRGGGRPLGATDAMHEPLADGSVVTCCSACGSTRCQTLGKYKGQGIRRKLHDRRYFKCIACDHRFSVSVIGEECAVHRRRKLAETMTQKRCRDCEVVKSIEEFPLKGGDTSLRRSYCRECANKQRAAHKRKNLFREYGITGEQYDEILLSQNGKCAVCGSEDGKGQLKHQPLVIDHCHQSGVVRGLLCTKCNLGIGNFGDDIDRLKRVVEYLESRST